MGASQRFLSCSGLQYKYLHNECLIYKVKTGETSLLDTMAANLLKHVADKPLSYSQLNLLLSEEMGVEFEDGHMENTCIYLMDAGLLTKAI